MNQKGAHVNNLRVGHINVGHLFDKWADIAVHISGPDPFHVFGISETWLNSTVPDSSIAIPGYTIIRRDPSAPRQTGVATYVHHSVQALIRR